ncbi:MAG: hypothetical protein JOZ13_00685 [Alphaproteobacteria bacterium]|nr:hypothetical protein [Alphaproteobacteria bacterium]
MRGRQSMGQDSMGWGAWLGIVAISAILAAAVGLGFYGGRVHPPTRHVEQVVPNDRFEH